MSTSELCFCFITSFVSFPQLLVNRSKRKRRRRADKAVTGSEKVKVINMRTGKKVRCLIGINARQLDLSAVLYFLLTDRHQKCSSAAGWKCFLSVAARLEGIPGGES